MVRGESGILVFLGVGRALVWLLDHVTPDYLFFCFKSSNHYDRGASRR